MAERKGKRTRKGRKIFTSYESKIEMRLPKYVRWVGGYTVAFIVGLGLVIFCGRQCVATAAAAVVVVAIGTRPTAATWR